MSRLHKVNRMMSLNLKSRVKVFLRARKKTLSDLADSIEVSETLLDKALADNSMEIRTLEKISKELQIPLFSFFNYPPETEPKMEIPFYTQRLPDTEESHVKTDAETLKGEIELLEMYIEERKERLRMLAGK